MVKKLKKSVENEKLLTIQPKVLLYTRVYFIEGPTIYLVSEGLNLFFKRVACFFISALDLTRKL